MDGLTGLFLPAASPAGLKEKVLSSPGLAAVSEEIKRNIQSLEEAGGGNIVLVIDQLDLLLAASGDQIRAVNVTEMLIGLREVREQLWEI